MKALIISVILITGSWASLAKNIQKHSTSFTPVESKGIIKTAKKYLGTKYKYGASTKTTKRFDCSSFVKHVYKKHGKSLPRTSIKQASVGKHVNKKNLKKGDLVFFSTKRSKRVGHVGIYIGNNKFIHASSGAKKVTISSLNKAYYKNKYKGARRV